MSVKYYFDQSQLPKGATQEYTGNLIGFSFAGRQNGFRIYENKNYIPMGFAFDYYCSKEDIKGMTDANKSVALTKALVLDADTVMRYADYVKYTVFKPSDYTVAAYNENCAQRRAQSCSYFKESTNGFDAKITLGDKKLVFFSVPYDKGWKATVNGKDAEVIKVDFGLCAVACDKGENDIKFTYRMRFFTEGQIITGTGAVIWLGYVVFFRREDIAGFVARRKKKPADGKDSEDENDKTDKTDDVLEQEDGKDSDDFDDPELLEDVPDSEYETQMSELDSLDKTEEE